MSNLTIARYDESVHKIGYSGYIEPEDRSWIIYLDTDGKPSRYYPQRDNDGAVIGEPVHL